VAIAIAIERATPQTRTWLSGVGGVRLGEQDQIAKAYNRRWAIAADRDGTIETMFVSGERIKSCLIRILCSLLSDLSCGENVSMPSCFGLLWIPAMVSFLSYLATAIWSIL
jgi:hypothetical protein